METNELIKQIQNLPLVKRKYVLRKTLHSIKEEEEGSKVREATEALYSDYQSDSELTAFSDLDAEDFYETR